MIGSNRKVNPEGLPSAVRERLRMQREVLVSISKLKKIHQQLGKYYAIVEQLDSCQEVVSAVAKLHSDHSTLLQKATDTYHQYVRKNSYQEWEELRRDALDAANFKLSEPIEPELK